VRVGYNSSPARKVDRTVAAIAERHDGAYSVALHQAYDPQANPEYIAAHVRRLEAMRRQSALVERRPDGSWLIAKDHAERGLAFDQEAGGARVVLLSPVPLQELADCRARTWLDQELVSDTPSALHDGGFGQEAQKALRQRRAWLIEQGLAREEAGRTIYRRDLLANLQHQEVTEAGAAYASTSGKRYHPANNGPIEGLCKEPVQLISGKFAVIEKSREFTLVPWRPVLERAVGKPVQGIVRGDSVSWTVGRTRGPAIGE
jgi:hypothetical protein